MEKEEDDAGNMSDFSVQSYNSAADYKAAMRIRGGLKSYKEDHDLYRMLARQSWNNIPLPVKAMFE